MCRRWLPGLLLVWLTLGAQAESRNLALTSIAGQPSRVINGKNLAGVRYKGPDGAGSIAAVPDGSWVQESAQGRKTYVLTARLAWVVHLTEYSRPSGVLLDLQRMKVSPALGGQFGEADILEVHGPGNAVASRVDAPPSDDCGGFGAHACKARATRCDEGLVESYGLVGICMYSSAKMRELAAGKPYPVAHPVLSPDNPEHARLLASRVTVHMVVVSFPNSILRDVTVQAKGADTIRDLIGMAAGRNNLDPEQITLSIARQATGYEAAQVVLDENVSVAGYNLISGTRLFVGHKPQCEGVHCRIDLLIYPVADLSNVRRLGGSWILKASSTIGEVKSLLLKPRAVSPANIRTMEDQVTLTPEQITLMFEGNVLDEDNRTLASYGVGIDQFSIRIGAIYRK